MSNLERELERATKDIVLSDVEYERMRDYVREYLSYKPIRRADNVRRKGMFTAGSFFRQWSTRHVPATIILALVMSGAGVSYAAEDSLPGEMLYPIKVSFNEEVQSAIIVDDLEQVEWQKARVERRLQELGTLAKEGRVDENVENIVTVQFEKHTQRAEMALVEVSKVTPLVAVERSEELEATLEAHEEALARIIVEKEDEEESGSTSEASNRVKHVVKQVRSASKRVANVRRDAESVLEGAIPDHELLDTNTAVPITGGISEPDFTIAREDLARSKEQAYETLEQLKKQSIDITEDISVELGTLSDILKEAEDLEVAGDVKGAYHMYRSVVRDAQRIATLRRVGDALAISLPTSAVVSTGMEVLVETQKDEESELEKGEFLVTSASTSMLVEQVREETIESLIAEISLYKQDSLSSTTWSADLEKRFTEAKTLVVRAEVAELAGDNEDDAALRARAHDLLFELKMLLNNTIDAEADVVQVSEQTASSTSTELPPVPPLHSQEMPQLDRVLVLDVVKGNTHTYSGVYYTPTACHTVRAEGVVAESYPEQVTIHLLIPEPEQKCDSALTAHAVSVTVTASESAVLSGFFVNGIPVVFDVSSTTTPADAGVALTDAPKGLDVPLENATPTPSFFQTVVEKTRALLQTN